MSTSSPVYNLVWNMDINQFFMKNVVFYIELSWKKTWNVHLRARYSTCVWLTTILSNSRYDLWLRTNIQQPYNILIRTVQPPYTPIGSGSTNDIHHITRSSQQAGNLHENTLVPMSCQAIQFVGCIYSDITSWSLLQRVLWRKLQLFPMVYKKTFAYLLSLVYISFQIKYIIVIWCYRWHRENQVLAELLKHVV